MEITAFIASRRETLLISDYATYRSSLSRQILSSRKRLHIQTPKRDKFSRKPLTAENIGSNHEYAQLQLLCAERAWAHAMAMKNLSAEAGKGITGSTRSHILSRLRKAKKIAGELVAAIGDRAASKSNDNDVLEGRAYAAMMAGAEEFERQAEGQKDGQEQKAERRWQECLTRYSEARVIYAALLESQRKEIFKDLLANTVDPTIRYAAYQAHLSRTIAIETVAKRNFPKNDTSLVRMLEALDQYALKDKPAPKTEEGKQTSVQDVPNSVTWRGRKANIVDASIGQALADVSAAEARLRSYLDANPTSSTRDKAAAYDEILVASQDAADATKSATDELEKEKVDEGDPRMQDLRVTSLAVNYDLVSWRVGRNRVLIGDEDGLSFEPQIQKRKVKRARKDGSELPEKEESRGHKLARLRERVVLYDATIQSIESVKDLRGAMRDAKFVEELDSGVNYFGSLKCMNIAYSHSLLGNHTNALALLSRAHDLSSNVTAPPSPAADDKSPPTLTLRPTAIKTLQSHTAALLARTHALVELHSLQSSSTPQTYQPPLVQRLAASYPPPGEHVDLTNLVSYPPKLEPVPVKPILLDVAFNYIDYPGRKPVVGAGGKLMNGGKEETDAVQRGKPEEPQQKKRGWFGFGRG